MSNPWVLTMCWFSTWNLGVQYLSPTESFGGKMPIQKVPKVFSSKPWCRKLRICRSFSRRQWAPTKQQRRVQNPFRFDATKRYEELICQKQNWIFEFGWDQKATSWKIYPKNIMKKSLESRLSTLLSWQRAAKRPFGPLVATNYY